MVYAGRSYHEAMRWAAALGLAACGAPAAQWAAPVQVEPVEVPAAKAPVAEPPRTSEATLSGAPQIEALVRAHLGDPALQACVRAAYWDPEPVLQLTFRRGADGIFFQSKPRLGYVPVSNCVNLLLYGWLPPHPRWTDAIITFALVDESAGGALRYERVRELPRAGPSVPAVSLVAGSLGGEGFHDGPADRARFSLVLGMAATPEHVFVADARNGALRRIDRRTGEVRTVLRAPEFVTSLSGKGRHRPFQQPTCLAFDSRGVLYVLDALYGDVSRVEDDRLVPVYDGEIDTPGWLSGPRAMVFGKDGALYVADSSRHRVVRIDLATRTLTEVAGERDVHGHRDGVGVQARFAHPEGLAIDDAGEHLYVSECTNHTIREITLATGRVRTLAGRAGVAGHVDGAGAAARFDAPSALVTDGGALDVVESEGLVIRRVETATGRTTTLAGQFGKPGHVDGRGGQARFAHYWDHNVGELPFGMARAPDGMLYLADSGNFVIRAITPAGEVTTLAGLAPPPHPPRALAYAADGELYATLGHGVYHVAGATAELVAGDLDAVGDGDGTGARARFRGPAYVAGAPDGSLLVAEENGRLRRVDPRTGMTITLATVPVSPSSLAIDPRGVVYLASTGKIVRVEGGRVTEPADAMTLHLHEIHGLAVDGDILYVLDDRVEQVGHPSVITRLRRIDLAARTHATLATWIRPWRDQGWPRSRGLALSRGVLWIVAGDGAISRFDLATGTELGAVVTTPCERGVSVGEGATLNLPHAPVLAPDGSLVVADEGTILRLTGQPVR